MALIRSALILYLLLFMAIADEKPTSNGMPEKEVLALNNLALKALSTSESLEHEHLQIIETLISLLDQKRAQLLKQYLLDKSQDKAPQAKPAPRANELTLLSKYIELHLPQGSDQIQKLSYLLCLLNGIVKQSDQNALIYQFHKTLSVPIINFRPHSSQDIYNRASIAARICHFLETNYSHPLNPELTDKLLFIAKFLTPNSARVAIISTAYKYNLPIAPATESKQGDFENFLKRNILELAKSDIQEERFLASLLNEILASITQKESPLKTPLMEENHSFWKIMSKNQKHRDYSIKGLSISPQGQGLLIDIIARKSPHIKFHTIQKPSTHKALKNAMSAVSSKDYSAQSIGFYFSFKSLTINGNSDGLALACLLHSQLNNIPVNPQIAVTGAISPNGKILPVGSINEKIKTALNSKSPILIIPQAHSDDFNDVCLMNKSEDIYNTQVFAVKSLKEALPLVQQKTNLKTAQALKLYKELHELPHKAQIDTLIKILALTPNHLAAKFLLDKLTTQEITLSFSRSVSIIKNITQNTLYEEGASIDEIDKARKELTALKKLFHQDTTLYIERLSSFLDVYKKLRIDSQSVNVKQEFIQKRKSLIKVIEELNKKLKPVNL